MDRIFKELKVLELASVLAGPSVGQFFAELGATVIKVENSTTGGDVTRSWRGLREMMDDRSAYFCSVNWGKKSVAVDLTTHEGRTLVGTLAAEADVVIASYKRGDAEKLGVAYEQLKVTNNGLIYGQITGYGGDDDRVGYDAVIQAETGFMDLNGTPDGEPTKMPVALVDVLASHHLKEALLLALLKKERTGVGSFVEVSLIQAAIASLVNQGSNWLVGKALPQRQGSLHPNIAPYGELFTTRDNKKLLVAIGNDRQFRDFCLILGVDALPDDERFGVNQERVRHRAVLQQLLNEKIVLHSSTELMRAIRAKKIPAGIIHTVQEVFELKEAQDMLMKGGNVLGVRNYSGHAREGLPDITDLLPPPHLGEHTDEVVRAGWRLK